MLNLIRACAKRSAFASLLARAEAPNLTGMGVEEAMAQVTLASSVDVCTPSTQTAQVDIIVKSLPMSKPQFSTMRGVKMTLYTECNRLWHFEACVPQPQHRLELDRGLPVKHAPHACQSFRLPPCMIGGMLHPAADGHDITPARSRSPRALRSCSPASLLIRWVCLTCARQSRLMAPILRVRAYQPRNLAQRKQSA